LTSSMETWTWRKAWNMNMNNGHAAWTCSMEMQHWQATWARSMDKYAACKCNMDIKLRQAVQRSSRDKLHEHAICDTDI
jgi:hypothetical protein